MCNIMKSFFKKLILFILIILVLLIVTFILLNQLKNSANDNYSLAIAKLDYRLCSKITENNPFIKDECYYKIAILKNDSSVCSFIQSKSKYCSSSPDWEKCGLTWYNKDVCYSKLAIQKNDSTICGNIQDIPQPVGVSMISAGKCRMFVQYKDGSETKEFLENAP